MNKQPKFIAKTTTQSGDKTYFHTVGAAWENKDGSLFIKLHATPVSGEILLFQPKAKPEEAGE